MKNWTPLPIEQQVRIIVDRIVRTGIDLTQEYNNWVNIAFALANALGRNGEADFHRLSALHPCYKQAEAQKLYERALQGGRGTSGVGTLFHLAQQAGVDIHVSPEHISPASPVSPSLGKGEKRRGSVVDATPIVNNNSIGADSGVKINPTKDTLSVTEEEKLPVFPSEVYEGLPSLLDEITAHYDTPEERDVLFLSSLVTLSACLPWVEGVYDQRVVFANLFLFISGKASAGKSKMTLCRHLVAPVHQLRKEQHCREVQSYYEELATYNANKNAGTMPPQKPPVRVLFLPANSSATAMYQTLNDNGGQGLMFETEGDTLANTFASDYGNYDDGLRKCFHHETISYNRRADRELVELLQPRLSVALSGTPRQIHTLIKDAENGLLSRFIFYEMNVEPVWKDVFVHSQGEPLDQVFARLGERFFDFYHWNVEAGTTCRIELTPAQQQAFHARFTSLHNSCYELFGDDILASIRRLGLIAYRLMMILSALRSMDEAGAFITTCRDDDFQRAMQMIDVLVGHSLYVFRQLNHDRQPADGKTEVPDFRSLYQKQFFLRLPAHFSRQEYLSLATSIGIKPKAAEKQIDLFIKRELIQRLSPGNYQKVQPE
ncbi:DUF3987 domain-containing protein [Bacteroides sp.]|uniref:DUF3987 domain-containing protein n=1 Tax=Bacteroides sp. TaxID=29523 RepID=UPI0026198758|nr:DUF3987 domain-containing protein [Bacteroides sp.]